MKRKTIVVLCMMAITIAISACGKKNKVDNPVEEVVTEAETGVADEAVEEISESDVAMIKYEAFLAGDEKVYVDKYDFVKRTEDGDYDYFGDYKCMTIEEFFKKVVDIEKLGTTSFPFESASYAYIDCGMDGIPELAMKTIFMDEWDQLERYYVIKLVDDKLELTYMDESYYRSFIDITNLAGVVEGNVSYGAASSGYQIGFLDVNARYVLDYTQEISYMALNVLPGRFDNAVADTEEDYSTLYLRRYAFELNTDGSEFDEYEKRTLYCAQKEADEESNGVDFKENERIAKTLFNYVGEKLYSLDEIKTKIAERESSIGFTDEIKSAGKFGWTDLELDSEYINGIEVIHVKNVDELMKNLADNTVICLAPGEYDISEWVKKNASKLPHYDWNDNDDAATMYEGGVYVEDEEGIYFSIAYLNDCVLRSEEFDNPAIIVNSTPDCNVLNLGQCENITLDRIVFKNIAKDGEYMCSNLVMSRCKDMKLDCCKFDGNKIAMGISILDSTTLFADSCEILNCVDSLVQSSDAYGITFTNSTFRDTTGDVLIQTMGGTLTFANSEFKNLAGTLLYPDRVHEVDFVDCEFDKTAQEAYDTATKAEETSVEYLYIDSLDSFRWEGPLHLYIKDLDGIIYHLSDTTVVASGVPCNDDGCDSLLWAARYIDHCSITDDSDPNGPYYCQGFGGSDVWEIRVDEKNNIKSVVDVFAVD